MVSSYYKHLSILLLLWIGLSSNNPNQFSLVLAGAATTKSYYDILGVPKAASPQDIKKAFRTLALKHHPDKGGKEEEFKELTKAYETLSDPEQKEVYDTYGEAGISMGANGPSAGGNPFAAGGAGQQYGGAGGGTPFESFFSSSNGGPQQGGQGFSNIDLSDILEQMMGGGRTKSGFQKRRSSPKPPPPPKQSYTRKVSCTLEELATGATKKLKVSFQGQDKVYTINLKPGWKEGTKVTFDGKPGGLLPTMVFVLQQAPHKFLRRDGNNLHYTCWISESEQTKGGIFLKVPLPTGEVWFVESGGAGVSNGEKQIILAKGMPIKGGPERGDLIVEFRVRRSTTSS
jgi:DnaJ-class molecular chaperone